jgi:hypothetical protein
LPVNYKVKPPVVSTAEVDLSDRLVRIKKAYDKVGLEYVPNQQIDKSELITIRYKNKYPEDVTTHIAGIYRILLPKPNMFELPNGELDKHHKVKQALIYGINEYVDNSNIENGPIGYHATLGCYQAPIIRYRKHDEMGNGIDPQVHKRKNVFYIEYTPEKIDEILAEMDNIPSTMAVAVAEEFAPYRFKEPNHSVPNAEEFRNVEDIEALIDASLKGRLKREFGGFEDYMKAEEEDKKKERPVRRQQVANTTNRQVDD